MESSYIRASSYVLVTIACPLTEDPKRPILNHHLASLSSDVLAWSQPDKGNISIFTNDIKRIIAYNVIFSLHVLPTLLIGSITALYLRLYLLPRSQSVPPYDPPLEVLNKRVMFACFLSQSSSRSSSNLELEPESGDVLLITEQEPEVERCYKGRCGGRWKPARTRHCTQCGVCRAGFDHHCPFVSYPIHIA